MLHLLAGLHTRTSLSDDRRRHCEVGIRVLTFTRSICCIQVAQTFMDLLKHTVEASLVPCAVEIRTERHADGPQIPPADAQIVFNEIQALMLSM